MGAVSFLVFVHSAQSTGDGGNPHRAPRENLVPVQGSVTARFRNPCLEDASLGMVSISVALRLSAWVLLVLNMLATMTWLRGCEFEPPC